MMTSSPGPTQAASAVWIECLAPLETMTFSGAQSRPWKLLYHLQIAAFTSAVPPVGV
jgi:hypothetical protein